MNRMEYALKEHFNSNGLANNKQYEDFVDRMCTKDFIDGVECDCVSDEECKKCWSAEIDFELEKKILKRHMEKCASAIESRVKASMEDPKPLPECGHIEAELPINEVSHPNHYNQGRYETIDVIEDWELGFNLGNALKYISRCEYKNNKKQDLEKALWYIQREIKNMEE